MLEIFYLIIYVLGSCFGVSVFYLYHRNHYKNKIHYIFSILDFFVLLCAIISSWFGFLVAVLVVGEDIPLFIKKNKKK